MDRYVLNLNSKLALEEARTGGKGASLARLCRHGFHVPTGFVITSAAFRRFLADLGSEALAQRRDWTQDDLKHICEHLIAARIPHPLERSICRAYRRLGGQVAVRSSMIGEDAHAASFAGQLDTYLNVEGESELLEAVKNCWASAFNWRLFSYLSEREKASAELIESLSMAVVIQRMVDAQAAGVAFSADPITGQSQVVIEAVRGLGDALVRGLVEPDRWVVDARGVIAKVNPAGDQPALEDHLVLHLAGIVHQIAGTMKAPQDVEWAWDGSSFCLLQSRPITSLIGRRIYSNAMVSEMLPGLVKPLVWSVSTTSKLKNVLGRIFTELIGPNDVDFALLAKRIHSRAYADNTLLGELLGHMGLPPNMFEVMSRDERAAARRRMPLTRKSLRTMVRLLGFAWRYTRVSGEISAFIERHSRQLAPFRQADLSDQDPRALLVRADRLIDIYSETMWANFIGPINMMGRNRMLNQLVQRWVPDIVPSDLLRGLMGLKSLEANRELENLAVQARGLGNIGIRLLIEGSDSAIRAALSTSEEGRALVKGMDAFLDRSGFLSASGTDPSQTPWMENPSLIWRAIGRRALDAGDAVKENVEAIREETRRRLRATLKWPHRIIFDRLLASTISYIRLREATSVLISEDSFEMRRTFLALADFLIQRGDLDERDDIFYLEYEQVRALVEGQLGADAARRLVATRRAEMQADALITPPDTICGEHVPPQSVALTQDQAYLVGISGSSGVAQGCARVVLDPIEAPATLGQDDILVVPFTDVSWTPLFSGIGGIVAETGGQLSHSAIVAREYGLPAVVNVKHATRLIQNGQAVTVDGNTGRVYLG